HQYQRWLTSECTIKRSNSNDYVASSILVIIVGSYFESLSLTLRIDATDYEQKLCSEMHG
ncbi:23506_t:CDS:1, partial [Racocetra persica]